MLCRSANVALVFSKNFLLSLWSWHFSISWSRIVSSTSVNSHVIAFCLNLHTNWSTFSPFCCSICRNTCLSKETSLLHSYRASVFLPWLRGYSIIPAVPFPRCATVMQLSVDRLKSLLPAHTAQMNASSASNAQIRCVDLPWGWSWVDFVLPLLKIVSVEMLDSLLPDSPPSLPWHSLSSFLGLPFSSKKNLASFWLMFKITTYKNGTKIILVANVLSVVGWPHNITRFT